MAKYDFSTNPLKLARAVAQAGVDATEDAVKELYVSFGGLLADEEKVRNPAGVAKKEGKKK